MLIVICTIQPYLAGITREVTFDPVEGSVNDLIDE
jgi:hypothetical protein